ncbi:hypothetical protein [Flagellimonas sp.]|uniref:hypothetical protein n=1 Tax=Flagellimonas sp. TaxID=2058762 RepID=UPI003BAF920E
MNSIKEKAHLVFWILGILLIALQVLFTVVYPQAILDLNIHDTYIIIACAHLFNVLGTWFILCGVGYWILKLRMIEIFGWMFWLHLIFTVLFPLSFATTNMDIKPTMENFRMIQYIESLWFFGLILFVVGQGLYFLNIFISTLKRVKSR